MPDWFLDAAETLIMLLVLLVMFNLVTGWP